MACRIDLHTFLLLALEEAGGRIRVGVEEGPEPSPLAELDAEGVLILHKKPIQALVDEPEQARPIIRNLIRWGVERQGRQTL